MGKRDKRGSPAEAAEAAEGAEAEGAVEVAESAMAEAVSRPLIRAPAAITPNQLFTKVLTISRCINIKILSQYHGLTYSM